MPRDTESPISPLVADLISASLAQTHSVTNSLIDSLTEQAASSRAEVDAIRTRITALLSGPYQPSPAAIEAALWPTDEFVEHFRTDRGES